MDEKKLVLSKHLNQDHSPADKSQDCNNKTAHLLTRWQSQKYWTNFLAKKHYWNISDTLFYSKQSYKNLPWHEVPVFIDWPWASI